MIESLCLFTGEKEFYDMILGNFKNLLVYVSLSLMRTTQIEFENMIKDPEGFVNLSLDTCDKQKSMIVKTQAAKLLEQICDSVDGAVTFIAQFCCQAINSALDD